MPLLDHEQPLRLNEWKGCASLSISGRVQSKHIRELERRWLTSGGQAGGHGGYAVFSLHGFGQEECVRTSAFVFVGLILF